MFYIYKILNKINGKVYIGQSEHIKARWWSYRYITKNILKGIFFKNTFVQVIHYAMAKHDISNFEFKVIAELDTQEETDIAENFWIKLYDSIAPLGYNIKEGGNKTPCSEQTKLKLSKIHKGKHYSLETEFKKGNVPWSKGLRGKGICKPNAGSWKKGQPGWNKGKKFSAESREKMSKAKKGKSNLYWLGRKHTEKSKEKMSASLKEGYDSGRIIPGALGKKRSEESKRKQSQARKGKVYTQKIFEKDIKTIIDLKNNGLTNKQIAIKYNVHDATICKIIKKYLKENKCQ